LNTIAEAPDKGIPFDHHTPESPILRLDRPKKGPEKVFLETLGRNLRVRAKGFSLLELSKVSGLSPDTIRKVFAGETKPAFSTLYRLSCILNCPITIAGSGDHTHRNVVRQ
jgi:hypothetical protein